MKLKFFILLITASASLSFAKAQTDSAAVATTFKSLLSICKNVDFNDPETKTLGMFYKAAPYVVYRGDDKKRAWKALANYSNAEEKKGVDEICLRINGSVNKDSNYKIIKYFTEKESEGTWYVLMVSYNKNGVEKKSAFAFLKINNRFALGDID
ncbi:MAG: hypothetical protein ABI666_01445 [Ferruginibacter sp.]